MKIILIDDKLHVREELKRMLGQLPYEYEEVLEAGCEPSAIQLIQSYKPDVIIADVKLLLLSEPAMLDWVDELHPHGKFIVTSSHPFVLEAFNRGGIVSLLKPVTHKELEYALYKAAAADQKASRLG